MANGAAATALCAIFCLFGLIGFVIDLYSLGQKPIFTVLVWTLFTGLMAVSYALVLTRAPLWILAAIAAHVLGSRLIVSALHHHWIWQVNPTIESGVKSAATWILFLSMLACVFFLIFIQGEGRQSVRIQTELSLAHGIQGTLVPEIDERRSGIEIYGATVSSDKVGGDLVDVVPLRDGTVVAYLADIAGHWLPAGILMGMVKTAVRTQLAHSSSPTALFESLNEVLPGVKEPQMYATCTALRIANLERSETAVVEYAIAGQPAILHVSASKHVTALSDEQFPLGLLPNVAYTSKQLEMRPGDVLVVATDGLLEAEDAKGEAFGLERLSSVLLENLTAPLDQIAERIRSISRSAYRQLDDQTLLLIRFAPRSESTRA